MTGKDSLVERRLQGLLSIIDQLVITLNRAGEVVGLSSGGCDWLKADILLERTLTTLFCDDSREQVSQQLEQAWSQGRSDELLLTLKPERLLDWREAGLPGVKTWQTQAVQISPDELLWVARDVSESRKLKQKVTNQAQRDPLTGAYNRRSLMTVLQQSLAQAQRYDWVCSFLMIDIDNFSDINDQYGWDTGDQVLQSFVNAMHGFKRTADFFARYVDDRFVMFLPETNRQQAKLASERVRALAQSLHITGPEEALQFTVSIGSATLRDVADTPESMLARAEEHLFIAKQSGSNRIEGEPE